MPVLSVIPEVLFYDVKLNYGVSVTSKQVDVWMNNATVLCDINFTTKRLLVL